MATYTYQQLYGTGSIGENLTGLTLFTFTNPSASSYFTLETIPRDGVSVYGATSPKNWNGLFSATNSLGLVTSSYIASVVVQPGTSSFGFKPSTPVTGSTYYIRGTGMYGMNTFTPVALFASSEKGVWFDASDLSTMFQDSGGTVPVTTVGQPVGKILDKSGNNAHAVQTISASRPTYQVDSYGWPYLNFDGVDDYLITPSINFTGTDKMTVSIGLYVAKSSSAGAALELGTDVNSVNGSFLFGAPSATADHSLYLRGTSTIRATVNNVVLDDDIITGIFDISQATKELELIPRLNQVQLTGSQITWTGTDAGTGNFGNLPLYIGARSGPSTVFGGHIYQIVVRGALSTATQIYQTENFIGSITGGAY
jgi:hypothetical protein